MDADLITSAALDVLDEVGLSKLTMRLVAARLDVQVGGLYYHMPDKSALLRSMANRVCDLALAALDAEPPLDDWVRAVHQLCRCLRATLHAHRDAALVLASGPLNGSLGSLALMERLIQLLEGGVPPERASLAADTLMAYLTGFVLQEQVAESAASAFPASLDELHARFPRVFALTTDDDVIFDAAISAILAGFAGLPADAVAESDV